MLKIDSFKGITLLVVLLLTIFMPQLSLRGQNRQEEAEARQDHESKSDQHSTIGYPPSLVTEVRLENGLKVLLHEAHTTPLVSIGSWYRVGSKDEQIGQTGISHWIEHMSLKGDQVFHKGRTKSMLEGPDGQWSGYIFLDQTAYFKTIASSALEETLKLEAERMGWSSFEPKDIEGKRAAVTSELKGAQDNPRYLLDTDVTAAALKVHPYRWPIFGWLEDLKSITRDQLHQYYRHYYTPNNAVLVLVGDFRSELALELIRKYIGNIPRMPDPIRVSTTEPEQHGEHRVKVVTEATTAYLQIAYRAPDILNDDFYAWLLLDAVLNGAKGYSLWSSPWDANAGKSSRLYRALIDRKLATQVNSSLIPTQNPYLYKLRLTLPDVFQYQSAEEAVYDELEKLKNYEINDLELSKAKNQLVARAFLDQDSPSKLAHQLGFFESIASFKILGDLEEKLNRISKEDLRRVAAKYFPENARTVGWFVPTKARQEIEVEKLSAEARVPVANWEVNGLIQESRAQTGQEVHGLPVRQARNFLFSVQDLSSMDMLFSPSKKGEWSKRMRTTYSRAFNILPVLSPAHFEVSSDPSSQGTQAAQPDQGTQLSSDRLPSKSSRPKISLEFQHKVLSNGVSVVAAENHYSPTVTISASLKAGAMRDSDQTAGLAHLVGRMLERGTRAKNVYQLAEGFEFLGAGLKADTGYLVTSVTVNGLKKDAEALIQLLAEMIQSPAFPQAEMEKVRTEILTELGGESDDSQLVAERVLRERIYPQGHPFRRSIKGSPKTLEKLRTQDLTSFHKRYYRPDQLIMVVAGDIRPGEVFQWVDKSFAKWTAQGVAEGFSMPVASPGLGGGEQVVRMNHKSQSEILFGLPGISRRDPDYYPLLILNQILGQSGRGGRLDARIRHQGDLASYLFSSFEASLSGGPLVIGAVVNPDRVGPVFTLVKEEIQKIKSDGVTEQEVKLAKSTLIDSLPLALEDNEGIARQLLQIELFELGEDYFNRFADLVEEVKSDRLLDCSRRRFLFDQAALVVVGPSRQKSK